MTGSWTQRDPAKQCCEVRLTWMLLRCRASHGGPRKTLADFGHPRRRLCDALLVLNVVMFGLQWYSKGRMLMWGAKVRLPEQLSCTANPLLMTLWWQNFFM